MSEILNKIAVITGGCRGIGKSMVNRFVNDDYKVYALDYSIPESKVLIIEQGGKKFEVDCIQCDVSNSSSVESAIQQVINQSGRIDCLINNAGITRDNLMLRMSEEQWDAVINTNLKGAFLCAKSVTKQMMSQRSGRIINIGSVVGTIGNAGQANYSASKAGMIGLTKSLAKEFGSRGILVNLIAPGYVITDMTDELNDEQKAKFLENIPLKRGATPEDIAAVAAFLAGPDSSYITGQVIHVNGGLAM